MARRTFGECYAVQCEANASRSCGREKAVSDACRVTRSRGYADERTHPSPRPSTLPFRGTTTIPSRVQQCGGIVCGACSENRKFLESSRSGAPKRVCDKCYSSSDRAYGGPEAAGSAAGQVRG